MIRIATALAMCVVLIAGCGSSFNNKSAIVHLSSAASNPATMSARVAPGLIVSPAPGTPDAFQATQISLLGKSKQTLTNIRVKGSKTGLHRGVLRSYLSATGASYVMKGRFAAGEKVSVSLQVGRGASAQKISYGFTITTPGRPNSFIPSDTSRKSFSADRFRSTKLQIPKVRTLINSSGVAPGLIFNAPHDNNINLTSGVLITDNQSDPVWWKPLPKGVQSFNLKPQVYKNKPVVGWWQGRLRAPGLGNGKVVVYNSEYKRVATVRAGNGLETDIHDFLITPSNSMMVLGYQSITRNLRYVGGPSRGVMLDGVLQEIDIPTGLVMYEWHAFGHVALSESYLKFDKPIAWDPYHFNSIQIAPDGGLVLTFRHTHASYNIDKSTGKIRWRLGGKRSSFRMGRNVYFAWQHDIQVHPNGIVSIFDNSAGPTTVGESRGEIVKLDFAKHKATLVKSYTHEPVLYAGSQGNAQILPNKNVFVGWGSQHFFSEYSPSGTRLFEGAFSQMGSYRTYRSVWHASPKSKPSAAAFRSRRNANTTTIFVSWNGATEVHSWRVLSGQSKTTLKPLNISVQRRGFETRVSVSNSGPYFQVVAVDSGNRTLGTSPVVRRK